MPTHEFEKFERVIAAILFFYIRLIRERQQAKRPLVRLVQFVFEKEQQASSEPHVQFVKQSTSTGMNILSLPLVVVLKHSGSISDGSGE